MSILNTKKNKISLLSNIFIFICFFSFGFLYIQKVSAQTPGALTEQSIGGVIVGQGNTGTVVTPQEAGALGGSSQTNPGQSVDEVPCGTFAVACSIATVLNYIADGIFGNTLQLANEAVGLSIQKNFELSSAGSESFVRAGWPIMRDVANLFFIFILLWIALATIFDFEEFSAKRLLPRFVVSALLINFSLAIGTLVISIANITGLFFYSQVGPLNSILRLSAPAMQIVKDRTNPDQNLPTEVAQDKEKQLTDLYNTKEIKYRYTVFGGTFNGTVTGKDCEDMRRLAINQQDKSNGNIEIARAAACAKAAGNLWRDADFIYMKTRNDGIAMILGKQFVLKLLLYIPMIFILFAIAALMIVRYVSLLFLLVLGPLAFLAMILPGTQEHWKTWWKKLINWSVFLPVFSILFYISIKTLDALNAEQGGADMLSYMLTLGFMIGTLLAAQQLGVAGANLAVSTSKKWATGAKDWAVGRGKTYGRIGLGVTSKAGLDVGLAKVPVIRTFLGKGVATGEKAIKEDRKRRLGYLQNMSPEYRGKIIAEKSASEAKIALETMKDKDRREMLNVMDYESQLSLGNKLRSVQSEHLVRDLTGDPRTYVRLSNPGLHEESPEFYKEVTERINTLGPKNIANVFIESDTGKKWLKNDATANDVKSIGSTVRGIQSLKKAIVETVPGVYQGMVNASDFKGTGTADFLRSTAGLALVRDRERRNAISKTLGTVMGAMGKEKSGQTFPENQKPKDPDKQDEALDILKQLRDQNQK